MLADRSPSDRVGSEKDTPCSFARSASSLMTFLSRDEFVDGSKSLSRSTPSLLLGRSFTWPANLHDEVLPRYLLIVFAFAVFDNHMIFYRHIFRPPCLSNKSCGAEKQQRLSSERRMYFFPGSWRTYSLISNRAATIDFRRGQWQLSEQGIDGNRFLNDKSSIPWLGPLELG